jgi:hypothetical protein
VKYIKLIESYTFITATDCNLVASINAVKVDIIKDLFLLRIVAIASCTVDHMNRRLVIGKSTDKYLAALVTGHDHFQLIEVNHQKHTKLAEVFKVALMIHEASNLDIRRV